MNNSTNCPNCGANIKYNPSKEYFTCEYCASEFDISQLLAEDKEVKIERIKTKAKKEIDLEILKSEEENLKQLQEEKKKSDFDKKGANFKKSYLFRLLLIFTIISSFNLINNILEKNYVLVVILFLQIILFILAQLFGSHRLKVTNPNLHKIIALIGLLMIIPYLFVSTTPENPVETIEWNEISMHKMLPEPPNNKAVIYHNSPDELWLNINKISSNEYHEYISACISMGYDISSSTNSEKYAAYNEDGYYLSLHHFNNKLELKLKENSPAQAFSWPTTDVAKMLPTPPSTLGEVLLEDANSFYITVYDINTREFLDYIKQCKDLGFTIDYLKTENEFTARNEAGYTLSLLFFDTENTLDISIYNKEDKSNQ